MANAPEEAPLARDVAGSEENLVPRAVPRGGSNSRAFKIAGLTTLACLLLASQVFTTYMVFDQNQQIQTLQKNSERMSRQLTRSSQVAPKRMAMPMSSLPLMKDFSADDSKTPMTKVQNTAVVSVEKQLMDLLKEVNLPKFNGTFTSNLLALKQQINESEWTSLESWMRNWLTFQLAQKMPTPATQPQNLKTKCQLEASTDKINKIGSFKPQCDEQGQYLPMQCWRATGYCWCVDKSGNPIEGTTMRGHPDCRRSVAPRRMMVPPMLMEKAYVGNDK